MAVRDPMNDVDEKQLVEKTPQNALFQKLIINTGLMVFKLSDFRTLPLSVHRAGKWYMHLE